jgi:hypothetical protein
MISPERIHYKRNFLVSLILSETILIFAFLFSPHINNEGFETIINDPIFIGEIIPATRHLMPGKKPPPKIPVPRLSEEIDAFDLLNDVKIVSRALTQSDVKEAISENVETGSFNTVPRLTYEVLPENRKELFSGMLNLYLKIDKAGKVVGHKVLQNSMECEDCIEKVIDAAYKSQWEPAFQNGAKISYWVQKSYVFN